MDNQKGLPRLPIQGKNEGSFSLKRIFEKKIHKNVQILVAFNVIFNNLQLHAITPILKSYKFVPIRQNNLFCKYSGKTGKILKKSRDSGIFEPGKFPGFLSRFVPGWTL